jgi:chemotaxis methyl-accepting protein methylase
MRGAGEPEALRAEGPDVLLSWVAEHVGLRIDGLRGADLATRLRPVREEIGPVPAPSVGRRLALEEQLRERVIGAATITETSFFRAPPQLKSLSVSFLPALRARRRAANAFSVRVWSAGCATGEEAYSLAILLLESVTPREAWSLEVLATDINASALAAAREGVYSGRSLEGVSTDRLAAFFEPAGPGRYSVRPEVRRIVRFRQHSLLEPPPAGPFDVVVCRNLLIYLRPEVVGDVLDGFGAVLRPDGALLLGDADVPALYSRKWTCVALGDAAYHRPSVEDPTR